MAKSGLLAAKTHTWTERNFQPAVVYTVPSDIDHVVVHLTFVPGEWFQSTSYNSQTKSYVSVNNVPILNFNLAGIGHDPETYTEINWVAFSNSLSIMLSPGDIVRINPQQYTNGTASCTVSGYEVDN